MLQVRKNSAINRLYWDWDFGCNSPATAYPFPSSRTFGNVWLGVGNNSVIPPHQLHVMCEWPFQSTSKIQQLSERSLQKHIVFPIVGSSHSLPATNLDEHDHDEKRQLDGPWCSPTLAQHSWSLPPTRLERGCNFFFPPVTLVDRTWTYPCIWWLKWEGNVAMPTTSRPRPTVEAKIVINPPNRGQSMVP